MGEAEVLGKVEMRRAALMLWAFAVIGRFPEVMKRCVLESWRTASRRKRWPASIQVDIREIDCEKGMPLVSDSKETTASFACVEALGVNMPPSLGWVPKPSKDGAEEEGGWGSPAAEWWIHLETKEWIYHKPDDMYFHLPSGGLWERREAESLDPLADRHTYYRVDAPHLQMLQQFAKSLDSSLLPLAFKGWRRLVKKKKEKERMVVSAPPGSPGASKRPSLAIEPKGASGEASPDAGHPPPFGTGAGDILQAAESDAAAGPAAVFPTNPPAGTLAERQGQGGILPSKDPISPAEVTHHPSDAVPLLGGSDGKPSSKSNEKRRGFLVCLCGRSARRRTSDSSAKTPQADASSGAGTAKGDRDPSKAGDPKGSKDKTADAKARRPSKDKTVDAVDWTKWMEREKSNAPAPIEALKPNLDTVDRHMKRLDQFMQEVKRNPQRLVDHVERRRQEKTHLAFMLF